MNSVVKLMMKVKTKMVHNDNNIIRPCFSYTCTPYLVYTIYREN